MVDKYKKGWFLWCPIFYNEKTQELGPRFKLWPLFELTLGLFNLFIWFTTTVLMIDIEPGYPIKINK